MGLDGAFAQARVGGDVRVGVALGWAPILGPPDAKGLSTSGWMHGAWELTNAEWDRLESFLPRGGTRGGRRSDHRRVINKVLYRVRTGAQWRDLPERFGSWEAVLIIWLST